MIVVGIGFGLIAILTVWTVVYWHDASTLSEAEQHQYMDGKGIANRGDDFYCSSWKGRIWKCNFSRAMDDYARFTLMGIMFLPITLMRPGLYFYVFYSTVTIAFLAQLYSYKVGIKWKHHLKSNLK